MVGIEHDACVFGAFDKKYPKLTHKRSTYFFPVWLIVQERVWSYPG